MTARWWLRLAVLPAALATAAGGWLVLSPGKRPQPVLPGEVVRSAQPDAASLRAAAADGVRTVVNLRGPRPSADWYQEEVAAAAALGLVHANVRVKLDDWPPQHEVRRLLELFASAPRPLLLHCRNGVDRTGWGAAVALALAGAPLDEVEDALPHPWRYLTTPSRSPLHRFFALYRGWLTAAGRAHSGAAFATWAGEVYCPPPYDAVLELLSEPPPAVLEAGALLALTVRVTNRSPEPWRMRASPERGIRLGVRAAGPLDAWPADPIELFRRRGGPARDVGRYGLVEDTVAAGENRTFEASLAVPPAPGKYILQLDMVDEHVHWFSNLGGPGLLFPLEVR